MNLRLVCKLLGVVAMLTGGTMVFSLPWAFPALGRRTYEKLPEVSSFESAGVFALLTSIAVCCFVGFLLYRVVGKNAQGQLFRKEAMAVVGLSWVLATVLGAIPFYLSGTCRSSAVRFVGSEPARPLIYGRKKAALSDEEYSEEYSIVELLLRSDVGARGLSEIDLQEAAGDDAPRVLQELAKSDPDWQRVLLFPEHKVGSADRRDHYRIRPLRMSFVDSLFESQSGFSTTGATVIADLEDPVLVPHCILFWRSSTHFLGGLGIIVLFVAILGQGSAGKALMRAEMPGPSKEGSQTRMQHTAWLFAGIYGVLNLAETILLKLQGMTWFDALCHAFGTMATGGFSTYNLSVGAFDSAWVDTIIIAFMILAGTNFTLLYFLCLRRPGKLLADIEWRTYMSVIVVVTLLVMAMGLWCGDFQDKAAPGQTWLGSLGNALRYGLFQVVAIMTTTGYGTHNFDAWNSFGRGALLLLMFVGGCAGSTGGGLKVIRHILFVKILRLEIEQSFHPTVVRPLRLGGAPVEDPDLRKNILVYFGVVLLIFVLSWMFLIAVEPDATWGTSPEHKLIDGASVISATLNNIGPGLGVIGSTRNYANFSPVSKLLFTWLMMLGRLELYAILVLCMPSFWRNR